MKNAIVLLALLAFPMFAEAAASRVQCRGTGGKLLANVAVESDFCRVNMQQNGTIDTMFCTIGSRYNTDEQVLVSRQRNGLSTLSQTRNIQTGNLMVPTVPDIDISVPNVICRLAEVK